MPTSQLMAVAMKAALLLPLIRLMSALQVIDQTGLVACTFNGPRGHSMVIPQANCRACWELFHQSFMDEQLPKTFRADGSSFLGNECSCKADIVSRTFTLPSVRDVFCDDNKCDSKCCFKWYAKLEAFSSWKVLGKHFSKTINAPSSWKLHCPAKHCGNTVEECGGWSGLLGLDDGYFIGGSKLAYIEKRAKQGHQKAKAIQAVRSAGKHRREDEENDTIASMCEQLHLPKPCSAKDVDRAMRCEQLDYLGLPFALPWC